MINAKNVLFCPLLQVLASSATSASISSKGWDECDNIKKELTCPSDDDRCIKAYAEGKSAAAPVSVYGKGCHTKALCDKKSCEGIIQDSSVKISKCEINCCAGDLCNGAKVPMVSATMLLACALAAFFR